MSKSSRFFFQAWRPTLAVLALALITYVLYFHNIRHLLPGYAGAELQTYHSAANWHTIWHDPINLPYKALIWLAVALGHHSILITRIVAASFGVIGVLVFMRRYESGPYFSLITLALVMFGYQLANQWSSVTGGVNGVGNIPVLFGLDRYTHHYYLVAAVCLASTALVAWLMRTPLGTLWAATAQNDAGSGRPAVRRSARWGSPAAWR